jgi:hypothetical protein
MRMLFSVACFMLVLCGSSMLHGQQNRSAFILLTKNDPKYKDTRYADPPIVGYFPDTALAGVGSNCHNFLAEMGLDVPGASLGGCGILGGLSVNVNYPSCGDVAEVYARGPDGTFFHLHSAIYLDYGYYLQRNGNSDIQISSQAYIDGFAPNGLVRYLKPKNPNSPVFAQQLALLEAKIPDSTQYWSIRHAFEAAKSACLPNRLPKPRPGITQNPPPSSPQNPPENRECYALSVQVCHYVNDLHIAIPQGLRAQYYACVQKAQQHAKSPIRVQC